MMKKILFTLTILLLAAGNLTAQETTNPELMKFVEEFRTPGNGSFNESKDEEKGIYTINSVDEESYKALSGIIEKYDIYFAEEIFGMELMMNIREGGSQTIVFQGDTYGLAITDNVHSFDLAVTIVKGSAVKLFFEIVDVETYSQEELYFNNTIGENERIVSQAVIFEPADVPEIESIERRLPSDITLELFDHYMPMLQELEKEAASANKERLREIKAEADSIYKAWEDEIALINYWIEQRIAPGEIKIPCTGNEFIVIPKNTRKGLYEWINTTGFCRTEGQTYNILTATEVAVLYTTKKREPYIGWNIEDYSNEMKAYLTSNIPGGEPTYMYRRSTTADGYERMKNDLQQFFYLDGKDKSHRYKGFKAIERIDTEEYCFLHLYGDNTTILIYDSHTEKYCQMDIIVGGVEFFNEAINDICINGIRNIAKKENIIIRDGRIELMESEVEINGVTYDSGVHFTTGYMENLK